ncbi:MAG: hypothetical protein QOF39_495, partial [Frankiales bacterium]|nr:hypothetical protein [Frankiales bacterium]
PASDGGSAITTYEYSTDGGATWRSRATGSTGSPLVISALSSDGTTPLVNGTEYQVELRAVNGIGAGLASAFATGIAATAPSAPSISTVTAGPASLQVSFAAGSNGGAAITGYDYRLGTGSWTSTGSLGNSFLVSGLTNGTSYDVEVRAVNAQGAGPASAPVPGTPVTTPAQPSITGVTRADRSLSLTVSEPDDGGSPVTSWQYSTDGGTTWVTSAQSGSPLTITKLSVDGTTLIANGTSYPVTVRAVNAVGTSIAAAVTTVGPSAAPSAPAITLTPLDEAIRVAFPAPADGGSPISAMQYQLGSGSWVDAGTLSSPFTIPGLTNGTPYTVRLRASNAIGVGAVSSPASATPRTVPDAPTAVAATPNTGQADVSWTAPGSNGGSAITGYVASAYSSAGSTTVLASCSTTATACSISGLTNGTAYYVSVVAVNAAGSSVQSAPPVLVTPVARPGAPTLSSVTGGNTILSLAFTAGTAGSSPITGYQYQLNGGAWQSTASTTSPLVLSGLTNGTAYTVTLRAVSAVGTGALSGTLTGTPYTFPDAPSAVTADGQGSSAVITWAAPNSNGSPITGYTATAFSAATAGSQIGTCGTATLTCTISGLTNGVSYYISLQATNTAGLSVRSAPRVAVIPSQQPGVVSAVTAVGGNGSATLTWSPGSTGASAVSDYTVWYSSGSGYTQFVDAVSTATSATVTGLSNGTAYTFEVYPVNGNGTGPASAPSNAVTPIAPGTVPILSAPVSAAGGYSSVITNYSAVTTYTLSATNGGSATRSGPTVTVTGLGSGVSSTVTVAATLFGSTGTSAAVTGAALLAGTAPLATSPARTLDGFSFQITNYVPSASYLVTASNGTLITSGSTISVYGLSPGAGSNVTVTVSRTGYTTASAVFSGAAMDLGVAPTFTVPTSTATGFSVGILNYSPSLVYSFSATNGAVVTSLGGTLVVSGLTPGDWSDITVTATDPGLSAATATVGGSALLTGLTPVLGNPTRLVDGYSYDLTNFSLADSYALTVSGG